jgi:tetratricopeptide (TPR) repeat protein
MTHWKSAFHLICCCVLATVGAAQTQTPSHPHPPQPEEANAPGPEGQLAPRLQNLGDHKFPVSTRSKQAQLFINQGFNLVYGFNHAEAIRAFREAARLDPNCAMAYWGEALALGPNMNMPMPPEAEPEAWRAIQKAVSLKAKASRRERDYIDALATRYSGEEKPDRAALDRAYAGAMRELSRKYPNDLDAATLFAEALMDLRPWDYWGRDGQPYEETREIVAVLESVLARNPRHPGATHYYIHAMEAKEPYKAEHAADTLLKLMPGAGHMVHMPSHIFIRVGRYEDAAAANEQAILADEDYITQCRAQGIYPLAYYPHNIHFLWASATMQGRGSTALEAARKTASAIPHDALQELPILQSFLITPYHAMVRFGKWEELLKEPKPHAGLFTEGMWHYGRGMALIRTGRASEAEAEIEAIRRILKDKTFLETPATFSSNTGEHVLRITPEILAGELAASRGEFDKALGHLQTAVRYEDALVYTEPPDWPLPVRLNLGAVLLQADRPLEAEVVFWEDLSKNPENGWALTGLEQALRAQGNTEQAESIAERKRKAWAQADVELTAARF